MAASLIAFPFDGTLAEDALRLTLDISQNLEYIDEEGFGSPRDEGLRARTDLQLGLLSETRTQRFELLLGAGIAFNANNDLNDEIDFEEETARLSYGIQSARSAFDITASLRERDVDEAVFLDDLVDPDLATDTGRRRITSLRSTLSLGREGPLTFDLSHAYSTSTYSGTTNPDLRDSTTQRVQATLGMRLSPVTQATAGFTWRDFDQEGVGGTQRTTTSYSLGVNHELTNVTQLRARVFYTENDTNTAGVSSGNDGLGLSLGLSHVRPNGTYSVDLSSTETVNGTRTQFSLGRSYDFKWGDASLSVGATHTEGFSTRTVANADVSWEPDPLSELTLSLSQSAAVDNNDAEILRTRLGIRYIREISARGRLSSGLQVANQNILDTAGADQTTLRANIAYRHDLANDWELVSGFEHRRIERDGQDDRRRNRVFVGFEKTFNVRP